jgi:hypothetical protein
MSRLRKDTARLVAAVVTTSSIPLVVLVEAGDE